MSDDANAGGNASGGDDLLPKDGADAGAGGGAGDKPSGAAALLGDGENVADPAEEDWRVSDAGGDEKVLRELKRYASRQTVAKALIETKARIRAGLQPQVPTLPENATDEQIAEYRKAIGIPETPDGYNIKFDDALKPSEADQTVLKNVLAYAHEKNIPPAHAQAMFDAYQRQAIQAREEYTANMRREMAETKAALRREYGADYMRNVGLLDEFVEANPELGSLILANIHNKGVVRGAIALARSLAPEEALYGGDGMGGGKSLDEQISDLLDKSVSGKLTKTEDAKLNQLYAARIARDQRRQNAA